MKPHWLLALMLTAAACSDNDISGIVNADLDDGADAGDDTPPGEGEPDATAFEGCLPDQCDIDGVCVANGAPNPQDPCLACLVVVDASSWSVADGAACDDGNACTDQDACVAGQCEGVPIVCDDDNACTDDACDEAEGCVFQDNTAPCDDGDACTTGDVCQEGQCGGAAVVCDDENPCTRDACDGAGGCVFEPDDGASCDDGDPCSVGDVCGDGECQAGAEALDCDDDSVCTTDACVPGQGCVNNSIADLCADDNPCTDELCDPQRGCLYPFNEDPCDDDSACTTDDRCQQGACLGDAVSLDDGNVCTDLSCDPETGIEVGFNDLPCDDNDACTTGDRCDEGGCVAGTTPLLCDDDNVCTDDACDAAEGCVFTPNTEACDDNNACTTGDRCGDGECLGQAPLNCDDGNACTEDDCDPETGCVHTLILSNACRPTIHVDFPPRAATLQGEEPVITVTGTVISGAGEITSLLINGEEVAVDEDGGFEHPMVVQVGGNILVMEAVDALESPRRRVQSFLWSPVYRQPDPEVALAGAVEQGLGIYLSPEVLDDGDRGEPINDLASIFGIVVNTLDIGSLIPDPVGSVAGLTIRVTSFNYGEPAPRLVPEEGRLRLQVTIPNVNAGLRAGIFNGSFRSSSIFIDAAVTLDVVDNELQVEILDDALSVSINNPDFNFSSFIINLLIGWLVDFFVPTLVDSLEAEFRGAIANEIGPLLQDALAALALDETIEFPSLAEEGAVIPIGLQTAYDDVAISPNGMALIFAARGTSPNVINRDNLGAMGRAGCLEKPQELIVPAVGRFELTLSDDTLNQLLHGAWRGGLLRFDLPPELLEGFDLGDLADLGVSDLNLAIDGLLQPTVSDCGPDGELLIDVGDLEIEASLNLGGTPLTVVIFASLQGALELTATEDGIGLGITAIETIELEINAQDEDQIAIEAVLASLIDGLLEDALLSLLGGEALGSFPLPAIDLTDAIEGLQEPLLLNIVPETLLRSDGNNIVLGDLR